MFVVMAVGASEAEILGVKGQILAEGMTPFDHVSNERVLGEFSEALSSDERERIEETLKRSRELSESESRDELMEALFDMNGVAKVLTRVMLQRAAGEAPASSR